MDITIVGAISAVISLITLIVFFVMASNVSKINKTLHRTMFPGAEFYGKAQEELYVGNKAKTKEYLLRAKFQYEVKEETYYLPNGEWADRSEIIAKIDEQLSKL